MFADLRHCVSAELVQMIFCTTLYALIYCSVYSNHLFNKYACEHYTVDSIILISCA